MPSTAEGRAISSKNSFKHGLAADEITEDFTETHRYFKEAIRALV